MSTIQQMLLAGITKQASLPITYVSATNSTVGVSAGITINKPAGLLINDVMVAYLYVNYGSDIATPSVGWTLLGNYYEPSISTGTGCRICIYYKVVGATEAVSFSWSLTASVRNIGFISAYRNVSVSSPINASAYKVNLASTSQPSPSITTTVPDTMLMYGGTFDGPASVIWTSPPTMTTAITTSGEASTLIAYGLQSVTGSTSRTASTNLASPSNSDLITVLIALAPA